MSEFTERFALAWNLLWSRDRPTDRWLFESLNREAEVTHLLSDKKLALTALLRLSLSNRYRYVFGGSSTTELFNIANKLFRREPLSPIEDISNSEWVPTAHGFSAHRRCERLVKDPLGRIWDTCGIAFERSGLWGTQLFTTEPECWAPVDKWPWLPGHRILQMDSKESYAQCLTRHGLVPHSQFFPCPVSIA